MKNGKSSFPFAAYCLPPTAFCPLTNVPTRSPTTCRLFNRRRVAGLVGYPTLFATPQVDGRGTTAVSAGADDGRLARQQFDHHPPWPFWFQLRQMDRPAARR